MPGAALQTAEAALWAGAGKLSVAKTAGHAGVMGMALPEARNASQEGRRSRDLLSKADAIVIGPSMDDDSARRWTRAALAFSGDTPLILDAAALKMLWTETGAVAMASRRSYLLLLPHPHA